MCDLEAIGAPSIFNVIRRVRAAALQNYRHFIPDLLFIVGCLLRRNKARAKQKTYKSVGVMKD